MISQTWLTVLAIGGASLGAVGGIALGLRGSRAMQRPKKRSKLFGWVDGWEPETQTVSDTAPDPDPDS